MRTTAALLFAVAAASGCASHHRHAASPATLQPIDEGFTLLPCPRKPTTTVAIEGCAEHEILRTDRLIEAQERTIHSRLAKPGRRAFVRAERSWLSYRESICNTESSKYAGGSIEPVVFADCVARQNRRHLTELTALRRELQQG